ncbi:MAG TPA: tetratricopeptide repeat protein [Verrucomicrobiae bacterium]|nr:tetratricopeptide repeat protein [Verrucomicrobiae bacterium]
MSAPTTPNTATQGRSRGGPVWRRAGLLCFLLALVTAGTYLPVRHCQFVNYDDGDYVTANSNVQGGLTWANARWAFTTGHASNWHPLTWLSHMLDWQLFGDNPGAQHLVNLGFHVANTLLLFLLLRSMTGAHWRSAFVAAAFALHPLHVESVAWISERKDVLSTFFFLLTLAAYVRYARRSAVATPLPPAPEKPQPKRQTQRKPNQRRDRAPEAALRLSGDNRMVRSGNANASAVHTAGFNLASLILFVFGLLSKPMLVTLPFVLLLLDYWPLERLSLRGGASSSIPLGRLLLEKVPFLVLATASSVVTFLVQRRGGAVSTSLSLPGRISNALVSYVRYLGKIFCPVKLSVLYPHPGYWPIWQVAAAAALLLAVCGLVAWRARKQPYLAVGWLWFLGALIPVIGLVQVGVQSMADRYTYIPAIGIFLALAWGAGELTRTWPEREKVLAVAAGVVLLSCVALTGRQLKFWQDSQTLFQHAVEVTDRNYLAYNNLGFFFSNEGKTAEALTNYTKSLEINPRYQDALNNMGYAMAGQKRYPAAIAYYQAALALGTNQLEVHNNLGNALADVGRLDEAIGHYRFVLAKDPEHAEAHNNLGIALAMQGKLDEAIHEFRTAIRLKPKYAIAHGHLGNALAMQHNLANAIAEYQICLELNPQDAQAHNNLGNALAEQGQLDQAISHYREALALNTNNPETHFNLGMALARQGKRDDALRHLQQALALNPDYTPARQQLERLLAPAEAK